jgi:hypothetical protein
MIEEEKNNDVEMIDSSSRNQKGQQPSRFQPPYQDHEQKIQEMNMEDFMDPMERVRA